MRFVVDLRGPSKVPTSFKQHGLCLKCFVQEIRRYLLTPTIRGSFRGRHLQQQLDIIQTNKVDRTPEQRGSTR